MRVTALLGSGEGLGHLPGWLPTSRGGHNLGHRPMPETELWQPLTFREAKEGLGKKAELNHAVSMGKMNEICPGPRQNWSHERGEGGQTNLSHLMGA